EAHCGLGHALQRQGRFTEALTHLRRGDELGSKTPGWTHPSARWVREAERLADLDARLPARLRGGGEPAAPPPRLEAARRCPPYRALHLAAARFYEEAFAANPDLAEGRQQFHRYNAACAAARAAAGEGADAGQLDDAGRDRWRKQALAWLRAEFAVRAKQLESARPEGRTA